MRCRPLELRAQNEENRYVPAPAELAAFRRAQVELPAYERHVTGRFVGTTDEIIQWAAWKWGIDEDLVRAMAVRESGWDMDVVGDAGESFGIMQIKPRFHLGTDPLARRSTAFNLDYYGAQMRHYYDGRATWLRRWSPRGRPYRAGSIWGSAGAWYAGRWYSAGARRYIASVRAELAARAWTRPAF